MNKILLIVDPQIDFISGSLAVEGAKEKMDALANALLNDDIDCDCVMVTKVSRLIYTFKRELK